VRKSVRKFVGVAVIGALGAFLALPMVAASAQETDPGSPGTCSFSAGGTAPGTVTGTVTVPDGATKVIVTFTPATGPAQEYTYDAPAGGGTVPFSITVADAGVVSANYQYGYLDTYSTGCTGPNGTAGISISRTTGPSTAANNAAALAFTGSSDTPSYVLIGLAAIVVGAILVVAARRRSQVR
jgi:LPXTG-motif cell wall-anchored protein